MENDEGGPKEEISRFWFIIYITGEIMFWLKQDKYFLNKGRCIGAYGGWLL